jgi:hypothetical protein
MNLTFEEIKNLIPNLEDLILKKINEIDDIQFYKSKSKENIYYIVNHKKCLQINCGNNGLSDCGSRIYDKHSFLENLENCVKVSDNYNETIIKALLILFLDSFYKEGDKRIGDDLRNKNQKFLAISVDSYFDQSTLFFIKYIFKNIFDYDFDLTGINPVVFESVKDKGDDDYLCGCQVIISLNNLKYKLYLGSWGDIDCQEIK